MCWDPNSQPPVSFNPDPNQNKEDASIISVVSCHFDISLSVPTQFCSLSHQNLGKNVRDPARIPEPWIQDPKRFLPIFMGFKSFHLKKDIKHHNMNNQAQYSEVS